MGDYEVVCAYLSSHYEKVDGYDFYKDIFPNNENEGEFNTDYSKPNSVYLYQGDRQKMKRRIMLKDTWEKDYVDYVKGNQMTLCSGLSYRGRSNKLDKAQRMNALIFDLDSVGEKELDNILYLTTLPSEHIRSILIPTYIVASGTGLHLYYVFKEPIDLYPNIKVQLKALKYDLTFRFWNPTVTSKEKQIQYQSINQGFRMVGSINGKYNKEVVAFRTGSHYTIDDLNAYADKKGHQVDLNKPFRPSQMTREQAKEKYPDWYQRVIVEGKKRAKKWDIKGKQGYALYEWWRSHASQIKGGHRYFYMMCMSIYACKCDVPIQKLKEDMKEDFSIVSCANHSNPLTEEDMRSALEMYSKEYYNFKIDDIEKVSGLRIERNKRNFRKQDLHLMGARAIQEINNKANGTNWRDNNGRPKGSKDKEPRKNKKEIVQEWRKKNPEGKKVECSRETGLDPKTVRKWW